MSRKQKITNSQLLEELDCSISSVVRELEIDAFFEHDHSEIIKENVSSVVAHIKARNRSIFFRLFGSRVLKEKIKEFNWLLQSLPDRCELHNEELALKRLLRAKELMPTVEGRALDDQQLYSVVYDVRNRLIVAGAGTGKTTTVVGLVKYLLLTGTKPEEILLLSFTNASVDELRERVKVETNEEVHTSTFHKLGLEIIAAVENKRPNITHLELSVFIGDELKRQCQDQEYLKKLNDYLRFGIKGFEDMDIRESDEKIVTDRGETVKSYGEKIIADFLYSRNIPYAYEDSYEVDVADEEHTQYHPDFHILDTDIYIEYFGIDRDGKTRSDIDEEEYNKGIQWKRELHETNGTRLVSLYYYQLVEDDLLDELQEQLAAFDLKITEPDLEGLYQKMEYDHTFQRVASQFTTSIALLKSADKTPAQVAEDATRRQKPVKKYLQLLEPIYKAYQEHLAHAGEIDFEDMLNEASKRVREGRYEHPYRYVIVDEYQDISSSRYRLLKSMRDSKDYRLFCVGDDWQSIYRFNGSDVGYILDFERFWGPSKVCRIERTYRFAGRLLERSGAFIQANDRQMRKNLVGPEGMNTYVGIVNSLQDNEGGDIERKLETVPQGATVLILGRYTYDLDMLRDFKDQRNPDGSVKIIFPSRPDLDARFMTVHGSKGLQADYVFIINCRKTGSGFPNRLEESPLLPLLLENQDTIAFAEERRLFYVAMTRARKALFFVVRRGNVSPFVNEVFEAQT